MLWVLSECSLTPDLFLSQKDEDWLLFRSLCRTDRQTLWLLELPYRSQKPCSSPQLAPKHLRCKFCQMDHIWWAPNRLTKWRDPHYRSNTLYIISMLYSALLKVYFICPSDKRKYKRYIHFYLHCTTRKPRNKLWCWGTDTLIYWSSRISLRRSSSSNSTRSL